MPAVNIIEHDGTPSEGFLYTEKNHWEKCEKCGKTYWSWHECQGIKKKED